MSLNHKIIISTSLLATVISSAAIAQNATETVVVTQPATTTVTPATATVTPATVTKETVVTPSGTTTTTTTKQVIVTPTPEAKEAVVIPTGFANCFTVSAGWRGNEWIPQHQVCQYENTPQGVAWIEGYWACTEYKMNEGVCTNWDWRAGHWVKSLTVY